jgi:hypothetical protein
LGVPSDGGCEKARHDQINKIEKSKAKEYLRMAEFLEPTWGTTNTDARMPARAALNAITILNTSDDGLLISPLRVLRKLKPVIQQASKTLCALAFQQRNNYLHCRFLPIG